MKQSFASDNYAGIHPDILAAIVAANVGHARSYGGDAITARAIERFRAAFGATVDVRFVLNGTAANVLALQTLVRPHEAVICAAGAHINVDECGAPERFLGSKLLTVATSDGKLTPELIDRLVTDRGDQHRVQPRVVSISQPTELGCCYSPAELQAIVSCARAKKLLVHVDGARLANAAAFLDVSLAEAAGNVDVLSFGGTKNGLMGGEAVISFDAERAAALPYQRKQAMQLASKMRFIAAQFEALLTDELWRRNAAQANDMARRLGDLVATIAAVSIRHPIESNAVFAALPRPAIATLQKTYPFYVWDEASDEVRWMTAWDTTADDVEEFARDIALALG